MRKQLSLVIGLALIAGMFMGCSYVGPGDGYYQPPQQRRDIAWATKNQLGMSTPDSYSVQGQNWPLTREWGRSWTRARHTASDLFLGYDVNDPYRGNLMPRQANFVGRHLLDYDIRDPYRGDAPPRIP